MNCCLHRILDNKGGSAMEKKEKSSSAEIREVKAEESELEKLLSQMPDSMRLILESAERAARRNRVAELE